MSISGQGDGLFDYVGIVHGVNSEHNSKKTNQLKKLYDGFFLQLNRLGALVKRLGARAPWALA